MTNTEEKDPKSTGGSQTADKTKSNNKTPIITLAIVFVIIIILAVAYFTGMFDKKDDDEVKEDKVATEQVQASPIIAKVDGVDIFESDVNARAEALVANYQFAPSDGGDKLSEAKGVALQQIINETLILNAAYDAGIVVTEEQIQTEFDRVRASFPDDETFWNTLTANNIDEDNLRFDMARQLTIQQYIDANTDSSTIAVTDEEVQDLYDQYASQQDNMPDIEEIRSQLEEQLFQQKLNQQIDALIRILDESANVEILS